MYLNDCYFSNYFLDSIGCVLVHNTTLKAVSLSGNVFTDLTTFAHYLLQMYVIDFLDPSCNPIVRGLDLFLSNVYLGGIQFKALYLEGAYYHLNYNLEENYYGELL